MFEGFVASLCDAIPLENLTFVHVLLNTPNRHQYLPVVRDQDTLLNEITLEYGRNLWDNVIGFEIIEGEIGVRNIRRPDEVHGFVLRLPGEAVFNWGNTYTLPL